MWAVCVAYGRGICRMVFGSERSSVCREVDGQTYSVRIIFVKVMNVRMSIGVGEGKKECRNVSRKVRLGWC